LEVSTTEIENRQAILTAKVEDKWLDPFLRTASRRLATRVDIPGFRRGKAPHAVIVQRMGKEALVREIIDDLGKAAYDEAVEESGLEPIQLDDFEIAEWEPLTLRMTVSLEPVIELGDYRSTPVAMEGIHVEDDDVQEVLQSLQEQYAEIVSVDRPAEIGDFALVDVEGTLEDRAVLELERQEYELREDAEAPVADFAEHLVGVSPGEQKSFTVTFADDYDDEDLAGQEVSLQVDLHTLQEKNLPDIDDDLARMVGGLASLDELREKVREDLRAGREAKQKDDLAEELLDSLVEQATIDSPPAFANRELEAMVRTFALDLQNQGFTLEGYLATADTTVEELLDEFRPTAERRVQKSLILAKLVEEESIEVDDSEIEAEVTRVTESYGQDTQALRDALLSSEQVRDDVRNRLYGRKIVERLSETAGKIEEEEVPEVVDDKEPPADDEGSVSSAENLSS
jgi:trigger factor